MSIKLWKKKKTISFYEGICNSRSLIQTFLSKGIERQLAMNDEAFSHLIMGYFKEELIDITN